MADVTLFAWINLSICLLFPEMNKPTLDLGRSVLIEGATCCLPPRWRPRADVYQEGRDWLIKLDLAGIRREDIEYHVSGARLTISGVRRDWLTGQPLRAYSMEIEYHRFERTFELPCSLTDREMHMEYLDGMLLVRLTPPRYA